MKQSYYNFILHDGDFSYWYNARTNSHFKVSKSLSDKLERILPLIDEYKGNIGTMSDTLAKGGFVIDNDFDELQYVRQQHEVSVNSKHYFLILLPTLDCNFKCWYCIQNHMPSKMDDMTITKVKRHIDHMIDNEGISSLQLDWFGGEPLLYFNEVVVPITKYAMERCEESDIPFIASSTTNGFFLTDDTSKKCRDLKFRQFQITLDGNRENHDFVKYQEGCVSAFDHVLDNIDNMIDVIGNVKMVLRINYTHDNLSSDIVNQINSHIKPSNRDKVIVSPHKVWQEKVDKSFEPKLARILELLYKSGYRVQMWNPSTGFVPCYTNRKFYNAINYNGHVVKCTASDDIHSNEAKGILQSDGTIAWKDDYEKGFIKPTFENERCLSCRMLPSCMGLCPREHINGANYCKQGAVDSTFETSLLNYIKHDYETIQPN